MRWAYEITDSGDDSAVGDQYVSISHVDALGDEPATPRFDWLVDSGAELGLSKCEWHERPE